jgi:hypothetical protein
VKHADIKPAALNSILATVAKESAHKVIDHAVDTSTAATPINIEKEVCQIAHQGATNALAKSSKNTTVSAEHILAHVQAAQPPMLTKLLGMNFFVRSTTNC